MFSFFKRKREDQWRKSLRREFETGMDRVREAPTSLQASVGHAINLAHSKFHRGFGSADKFVASSETEQADFIKAIESNEEEQRAGSPHCLGYGLFRLWLISLRAGDAELNKQFSKELEELSRKGETWAKIMGPLA